MQLHPRTKAGLLLLAIAGTVVVAGGTAQAHHHHRGCCGGGYAYSGGCGGGCGGYAYGGCGGGGCGSGGCATGGCSSGGCASGGCSSGGCGYTSAGCAGCGGSYATYAPTMQQPAYANQSAPMYAPQQMAGPMGPGCNQTTAAYPPSAGATAGRPGYNGNGYETPAQTYAPGTYAPGTNEAAMPRPGDAAGQRRAAMNPSNGSAPPQPGAMNDGANQQNATTPPAPAAAPPATNPGSSNDTAPRSPNQ
jgi:hypothetical protein